MQTRWSIVLIVRLTLTALTHATLEAWDSENATLAVHTPYPLARATALTLLGKQGDCAVAINLDRPHVLAAGHVADTLQRL
jgi:hypothetical protein